MAVDISNIIGMVMGFLMWATPLIYSDKVPSPFLQAVIKWNPLTYLVCSCRDIILFGRLYEPAGYVLCAGLSLVAFLISWRLFYVSEDAIVERMV